MKFQTPTILAVCFTSALVLAAPQFEHVRRQNTSKYCPVGYRFWNEDDCSAWCSRPNGYARPFKKKDTGASCTTSTGQSGTCAPSGSCLTPCLSTERVAFDNECATSCMAITTGRIRFTRKKQEGEQCDGGNGQCTGSGGCLDNRWANLDTNGTE